MMTGEKPPPSPPSLILQLSRHRPPLYQKLAQKGARGTPISTYLTFTVWTIFHSDQTDKKGQFLKKKKRIPDNISKGGLIELENTHFANAYEIANPSNSSSTDAKKH